MSESSMEINSNTRFSGSFNPEYTCRFVLKAIVQTTIVQALFDSLHVPSKNLCSFFSDSLDVFCHLHKLLTSLTIVKLILSIIFLFSIIKLAYLYLESFLIRFAVATKASFPFFNVLDILLLRRL